MPTPVNTAKQCLTQEAAAALEDAVSAAKKRGHPQTTSIHMVSSLLSNPSSNLREACTHARSHYAARAQLKALELSLSVSLDRLPSTSSSKVEDPPVANSLMAAMKRSQAAQRRLPENFSYYYQQQEKHHCSPPPPSPGSSSSSVPAVKVELKNLLVSILDDPLVSRVFADAGFRSCDVKMALIRPNFGGFHGSYGASRFYRRPFNNNPPMFLCNFPFMGSSLTGDEQCWKTISGIMVRERKKNPLILGVGASDLLGSFLELMKASDDFKPQFPQGLTVVSSFKDEILKLSSDGCDKRMLKFDEVEALLGKKEGVVLNFGDLEALDAIGVDELGFLVGNLRELLDLYRGNLWLIGAVGSYDVYFRILNKVSNMDRDLDLEIVPTLRFSMGGSPYPRSSLMESFVPLGGFFPTPSEMKGPAFARFQSRNDGFERELASLPGSLPEEKRSTLPFRSGDVASAPRSSTSSKGKDDYNDKWTMNAKATTRLRRKWDNQTSMGFRASNERDKNMSNDKPQLVPIGKNGGNLEPPAPVTSLTHNLGSGIGSRDAKDLFHNPVYNYVKDPKLLHKDMVDKVGHHHEEAVGIFLLGLTQNRANRSHLWMSLKGPDGFVKQKLGLALAEILHGSTEGFVYVDLSFEKKDGFLFETLGIKNSYEATMRGTVIDYLVEKLSKGPSVVFFDHIEEADVVVQSGLLRAIEAGRFVDLSGREANIVNSIFLCSHGCEDNLKYSEEDVLRVKNRSVQLVIGYDLNDDLMGDESRPFDSGEKWFSGTNLVNKRKLFGCGETAYREGFEGSKRANKSANSYLDLNLPAEEDEVFNASESDGSDCSNPGDSRSSWQEDFERRINRVAEFEPFDFASTAEKLQREMVRCLKDVVGDCKCSLEIEGSVLSQIVAAAYLYGDKKVEDWIRSVVRRCFLQVVGRFDPSCRSIVKLVACEETGDGLLPARIIMN